MPKQKEPSVPGSSVVTQGERRAYGWFFVGQNMVYLFILNYIQNYFTDVVGITAGSVAVIILIARVWDAVDDPMIGVIVDRSRLKGGRFKPWLKLSTFIVPLFTVGIFCVPMSWSLTQRTILCGLLYVMWSMVYTLCDAPIYSLSTAMTNDLGERTSLIARGRFHSFLGILTVMVLTVPLTGLVTRLTGNAHLGWLLVAILFSIVAFFFMRPISGRAQERYIDQTTEPITLKQIAKYLFSNKYLLIFYGALIVSSLTNTTTILPLYFVNVNLGNPNLYIVVVACTMIASPFVSLMLPRVNRRFDKFHIYMFGLATTIVASVVAYFVGYEGSRFIPFLIISAVKGLGFSVSTVMSFMFSADCIEYGAYRSGQRAEGVTFSIQTFTTKMTGAISGFVAMALLGWLFHYQSSYYVDNVLVVPEQPASAATGIWFMYSIFPAFGALVSFLILLRFYKLRDVDVQIMADINSGKITREEGEQKMAKKETTT